ncbi:MAG: hypothetical protein ABSH20_05465, partial [Tepidisphaeraceae bacterium]
MDRPCLNPGFDEEVPPPTRPERSFPEVVVHPVSWLVRILLLDLAGRNRDRPPESRTLTRLISTIIWRIALIPMVVPPIVAACVFIGTHPPRWVSPLDPASHGIYYDPVAFVTADEVRLE